MKLITFVLFAVGFSTNVWATVDANTRVFIVAKQAQEDEYFVERVPVIGCYGLPQGPQLAQFTAPYFAPTNVGCGDTGAYSENINALSCAKVVSSEEASDFSSFSKITLDISQCEDKANPQFITMVRTAAKLNFPQPNKKKEVQLTLLK